jgi:hypothetical protein
MAVPVRISAATRTFMAPLGLISSSAILSLSLAAPPQDSGRNPPEIPRVR